MIKNIWKIILPLFILIVIIGYLFVTFNKDDISNIEQGENFVEEIEEDFLFDENLLGSLGIKWEEGDYEIGKYEEVGKNKERRIYLSLLDESGADKSALVKVLDLNNENITYILENHTNYFETGELEYSFEPDEEDDFKSEEEYVTTGTAVISEDDRIYVVGSTTENGLDAFLTEFSKHNQIVESLFDYLQRGNNLSYIDAAYNQQRAKLEDFQGNVSDDIKEIGLNMWRAYEVLDIEKLDNFYADDVWFFADDEWEDYFEGFDLGRKKKFIYVDKETLFDAYVELKKEEFKEEKDDYTEDDIVFYRAGDLITACFNESKKEFFDYFRIESDDDILMMYVFRDSPICTVEGNFYDTERFWVFREINGEYRVVTDQTE